MFRENIMRQSKSSIHTRFKQLAFAALIGGALALPAAAQYRLTVNGDRLLNAQNEPHNWLLMNGEIGRAHV